MGLIVKAALGLASMYGLVVFGMWLGQRRLMYVPDATRHSPPSLGLSSAVEATLSTPDGATLVVWRIAARSGQPTILYFHGNAGNLGDRAARFQRYAALGYGVATMSYRSYGGSTGSPSEANNIADARLLYDSLVSEGIAPQDIVLYGESLGSGVAVQLASFVPVGGVVLDAPYTSIVKIAARAYPYLPVRPLLSDKYESERFIANIGTPLLILHGAQDSIIPVSEGQTLFDLAEEPKKIVVFPRGQHTDLDDHGAVRVLTDWIANLRQPH